MGIGAAVIKKVGDPYSPSSFASKARAKRWDEMLARFPELPEMKVVDLGGNVEYWKLAPVRPAHLTIVDPVVSHLSDPEPWMTVKKGDACDQSLELDGFDLCHSNSVIEHVGGAYRRRDFAATVKRAAPHHWIQTPYRYFPIEPHWLFPGFQFLPLAARKVVTEKWPMAQPARYGDPVEVTVNIELLTLTEMRNLFPHGDIYLERAGGLVKSITAVR